MREKIYIGFIGILFLGILAIWFLRFLGEIGVISSKSRIGAWCSRSGRVTDNAINTSMTKKEAIEILGLAFGIRIVVYIVGIVVCMLFSDIYSGQKQFSFWDFLDSWNLWDSPHYIDIAKFGYQDCIENGEHLFLVFFPLYPWLLRVIHIIVRNWEASCLILSTLSFCIGSVFFYGLVKEEFGRKIAKRSFWLLSLFPFAFFFGGMMTESLFFCLLSAGFFYIKRHNWLAAGVLGIFCSLCRVQGILLLGVGLVEFFVTYQPGTMIRNKEGKQFIQVFFTKGIWLFLMPIGNLIYFGINYKVEGEFFRFQVYQKEHWYHTTTWVFNCLRELFDYGFGESATNNMRLCVWLPELVLFVVAIMLIIYALRRHPLKYSAFLIVYTTVNYSVTFLISGGRYMSCALPMFIILAEWTKNKPRLFYMILLLSTLLFGVYLTGYMTGQQIM